MDRKKKISEEEIDQNLVNSFPASDPPAWTLGLEEDREPKPEKPKSSRPSAQKPAKRRHSSE